jgi:hypothetical protein
VAQTLINVEGCKSVNPNTHEWIPTFGVGNLKMFWIFEARFHEARPNLVQFGLLFIIEKVLKIIKVGLHFQKLNHKL